MKNVSCDGNKPFVENGKKCICYLRLALIAFIINFLIALFIVMFEGSPVFTVLLYLARSIFFINVILIGLSYAMAVKNAFCSYCHKRISIKRNNILRIISSPDLLCDNCCIIQSENGVHELT